MTAPALLDSVQSFLRIPRSMLIGANWVQAAGGQFINAHDPATSRVIGKFPSGDKPDIDAAVAAATAAFSGPWRRFTPFERGRKLQRMVVLLAEHQEELKQLIVVDNGKPLAEADRELQIATSYLDYYAGWTTKIHGQTIPVSLPGQHLNYTVREPIGVVGCITPPNYPVAMPIYKLAPALAAGNTLILKPAEQASLASLRLIEVLAMADLPPGVINIVTGHGETAGAALAAHPEVQKISFTGSTAVGRLLIHACAGNLKRLSLELGGKSPNIVFADANMEDALEGVFRGIFFCQGEVCSAGSRLYVEESIYKKFLQRLVQKTQQIRLGHGLNPRTTMGPLVSLDQQMRVLGYIESALEDKAKALVGGKSPHGNLATGYFIEPTIFDQAHEEMKIVREEVFGPVACAFPFKTAQEVVAKANQTSYGLAAGVWTNDLSKAHAMAGFLRAGTVWINCYNAFDNASPWGGFKESGWGREKGEAGLGEFTELKSVLLKISS